MYQLGDYEALDNSGTLCYDVAYHDTDTVMVAKREKLELINVNSKIVEKSILFSSEHHPFSIVNYKSFIIVGFSWGDTRTKVVIYDGELNVVNEWIAAMIPCDLAVVDDKVILSNQHSSDLKVFSLDGKLMPSILWNGTSAGIVGIPPNSLMIADERYNTVYKKQVSDGGDILWSVPVQKPFSLCFDEKEYTWVRCNADDSFTILTSDGKVAQKLKNEKFTDFGEILGIMVHDGYLYVCHSNGMGRLQLLDKQSGL